MSFVINLSISVLLIDLPNVEIEKLSIFIRELDIPTTFPIKFRRNFTTKPKVLVFQSLYVPSDVYQSGIYNKIRVLEVQNSYFSLQITSSYRYWRGYYIACEDAFPYQCDFGEIRDENLEYREKNFYYYRADLNIESEEQLTVSYQLFSGF